MTLAGSVSTGGAVSERAASASPRRRAAVVGAVVLVLITLLSLVLRLTGADDPASDTTGSGGTSGQEQPVAATSLTTDPARKLRAAQITSSYENSTTELQYGFADNIGDGRGITAGRAGFTSGTHDLLLFVQRYTEVRPDNPLAPYLPALEAVNGSDSEEGLEGFVDVWEQTADDPLQREVQDDLVDELYFTPAMAMARDLGVGTPLGQAIVWDTMIQHGAGGENGTMAIIEETTDSVGTARGNETEWLQTFLDVRLRHLLRMYDDTATNRASSTSRVQGWRSLIDQGEFGLDLPITWVAYGRSFTLSDAGTAG
jgi:chitosanase